MSSWRLAGLNYINYSNIAAKVLRKSLKSDIKQDALKRDESFIKLSYWSKGEPLPEGEKRGKEDVKV